MSLQSTLRELGLTQALLEQGVELLKKPRSILVDGELTEVGPAVVIDEDRLSLADTYAAERRFAERLLALAGAELPTLTLPADLWGSFKPHEHQVEAIERLCSASVMVITGGPGVGKTTLVKKALEVYRANGLKVLQVAPTGKAANRMAESTDFPASTIHRALGFNGTGWVHTASNPLPASVLIIDEASMVACDLGAAVLDAAKVGTRILIVGDVDQLPSIQAGRVLHDVIVSGTLPVVRLTKIFRQASESRIPYVARDINEGRLPNDLHAEGTDVRFIERASDEAALDLLLKAVTTGIPQQKGIPSTEIQVLCAQKGKILGVGNVNLALQATLNPAGDHESDVAVGGDYQVRAKDRVIHTKNNYKLGVMNGEMGWVLAASPRGVDLDLFPTVHTSEDPTEPVDAAEIDGIDGDDGDGADWAENTPPRRKKVYVLVVDFTAPGAKEPRVLAYTKEEARELHLGYAITVHKSQGSQFKAVVLPVDRSHAWMLTRALTYTAVTRSEKYCLMIGQAETLAKAARNTRGTERRTNLQRFLTRS